MNTIVRIGIISLCAMFLFSCNKEEKVNNEKSGEVFISFEVGPLEIGTDTKMQVGDLTVVGEKKKYPISWDNGDQISIIFHNAAGAAGRSSDTYVANTSARRFTTTGDGIFSGLLNLDELNALGGEKDEKKTQLSCFMVYPATTFTVSQTSYQEGTSNYFYYEVTGAEIPDVQDGTGWKYCYFTALYGSFGRSWKGFTGNRNFILSNTLLRFSLANSTKSIKNIQIVTDNPQFVGPVTFWMGHTSTTEFSDTGDNYNYFKAGGAVKTLNIHKDDYSALPNDIWFACCKGLESGKKLTITFTSTDDKTCTCTTSAPKWMGEREVYNMGTIDLSSAVWE